MLLFDIGASDWMNVRLHASNWTVTTCFYTKNSCLSLFPSQYSYTLSIHLRPFSFFEAFSSFIKRTLASPSLTDLNSSGTTECCYFHSLYLFREETKNINPQGSLQSVYVRVEQDPQTKFGRTAPSEWEQAVHQCHVRVIFKLAIHDCQTRRRQFSSWFSCMGGHQPDMGFTQQDFACSGR